MMSATTGKSEKMMASEVVASGADESGGDGPGYRAADKAERGGFFHIYKRGQGYWTRMGTVAAAALLAALTLQFLYVHLRVWLRPLFEQSNVLPGERGAMMAHAESLAKTVTAATCGV